jgi:hypothetical protein
MNAANGHRGRHITLSITPLLAASIDGTPVCVASISGPAMQGDGQTNSTQNVSTSNFNATGNPREWPMGAAGPRSAGQPGIRKTTI